MEDLIGGEDWEMGGSFYILSVNTLKSVFSLLHDRNVTNVHCDL